MTVDDSAIKSLKELTAILRAEIHAKKLKRKNAQGTT